MHRPINHVAQHCSLRNSTSTYMISRIQNKY